MAMDSKHFSILDLSLVIHCCYYVLPEAKSIGCCLQTIYIDDNMLLLRDCMCIQSFTVVTALVL